MKKKSISVVIIIAIIAAIIGGVMVWKNNNQNDVVDTPVTNEPVIENPETDAPADDEAVADVPNDSQEPVQDEEPEAPNDSQEFVEDSNAETPDVETEVPTDEPTDKPENSDTSEGSEDTTTDEPASTDEPTNNEADTSNETETPVEEETHVVHTHEYGNWVSNNDGTHTKTCSSNIGSCDVSTITEKCANDPCTDCGYTVPHTHSYTYTSNGDGTHTASCTSTTGTCNAKTLKETCNGDPCANCGYTKPQEPVDIIPTSWNGVGVNHAMEWMSQDAALEGMPNTAAVIEELSLAYKAEGNALAVEHVAICNNIITDGLVLKGFSYSSVSRLNYAAAIALLKDVLDAESATALVNWIEELDRLHQVYYNAKVGSEEEAAAKTALYAHGNKLWEATSPVKFGNVLVSWYEDGNVIGFIISNA